MHPINLDIKKVFDELDYLEFGSYFSDNPGCIVKLQYVNDIPK